LVTKSDADAVFGVSMGDPKEETIEEGGGMRCSYVHEVQGNQKLVKVEFFPTALAAKTLWSSAKDRFAAKKRAASSVRQIVPAPGLGDDAFDDGVFGLHVLKGDNYFVITLKGFEGIASTDEQFEAMIGPKRRAAAESLARKIVAGVEKRS
jgi:hypothetical protein